MSCCFHLFNNVFKLEIKVLDGFLFNNVYVSLSNNICSIFFIYSVLLSATTVLPLSARVKIMSGLSLIKRFVEVKEDKINESSLEFLCLVLFLTLDNKGNTLFLKPRILEIFNLRILFSICFMNSMIVGIRFLFHKLLVRKTVSLIHN
jgi:hypothetical protein